MRFGCRADTITTLLLAASASAVWAPDLSGQEPPSAPAQLSVQDHERILRALLDDPLRFARNLDLRTVAGQDVRPSGAEVLGAALAAGSIDGETKQRITRVLGVLPLLQAVDSQAISDSTRAILTLIRERIDGAATIDEVISALKALRQSIAGAGPADGRSSQEQVRSAVIAGLDTALSILARGQRSVYQAARSLYQMLGVRDDRDSGRAEARKSVAQHVKEVAASDAFGAIEGAVRGCIAAAVLATPASCLPGAGEGAIAGAIESSAFTVLHKFLNWLFAP